MRVRHVGVVAVLALAAAACGSSSSKASNSSNSSASSASSATSATPSTTAAATAATPVKLGKVGDETHVVNDKGFTVYSLATDTATSSSCGTGCDTIWPPVTSTSALPATISGIKITELMRSDGTKQVVVNGHPVYTYSGDTGPGQEKGQGVLSKWYYLDDKGNVDKG